MHDRLFSRMNPLRVAAEILLPAALIAACLYPIPTIGQTQVSDNWNGGTGNWSDSANWSNGVPNNSGGNVYNVTIGSSHINWTTTLDMNASIATLILGVNTVENESTLQNALGNAETLNISGGLTVNGTGVINFSGGSILTVGGIATNAGLVEIEGSTLTVSGNVNNSGTIGTNIIQQGGASTVTVSGILTNDLWVVEGSSVSTNDVMNIGTLVNNFEVVNSGTMNIGNLTNNGVLLIFGTVNLTNQPSGITDVVQGSTLDVGGAVNAGSNNGLANLNSVEGSLFLNNGNTTTVTPGSGTLTVSKSGSLTTCVSSTLAVTGNIANSGIVGNIAQGCTAAQLANLMVTGTFTNQAGAQANFGSNSNVGQLINNGTITVYGTLNLTNQPSGITDVVQGSTLDVIGTVNAGSNNGLANLNSVEGSLFLNNGNTTTVTPGSGTLTVSSSGVLILDGPATLTVSGNMTNSGTVQTVASGASLVVSGPLVNNGSITLGPGTTLGLANDLTNNGTIAVKPMAELVMGSSSITLAGHGKVTLSGGIITGTAASDLLINSSTIQGSGTIGNNSLGLVNDGIIIASGKGAVLTINPSSVGFNNHGTIEVESPLNLSVKVPTATLKITGPADSFLNFNASTGTLTGGTYLIVNGTLEFDNSNIVTNAATILLSGTRSQIIDQNGVNGLTNLAINAKAGTFNLAGNQNFTTSGAFSNSGKVTIATGSTFSVGGTNSYTQTGGTTTVSGTLSVSSPGDVTVSGGSVFGIGTVAGNINLSGGLLSPGAASKKAGKLTVSGTYIQSGSGTFTADLGGTSPSTQYDVLNVTSTASLSGTLNVDLISGFRPVAGSTFDIMNFTSEMGTFTTLNLPIITGDHWTITYNPTDVVLTLLSGAATVAPQNLQSISMPTPPKQSAATLTVRTREPSRIPLTDEACSGWRILSSFSCVRKASSRVTNSATMRPTQAARTEINAQRDKIAIASTARSSGGARTSSTPSAFTIAAPSFNVCNYVPTGIARMMGCR